MAFLPLATSKKFPFKCHEMLHYAEKNGLEEVVSWLPGGKGFRIHDHELFCKKVLKATFNHSNYKSFEKQLNNWNFQREVTDKGKAYSNPNFMRGRKSLCQVMTSKSTRTKKATESTKKDQSQTHTDGSRNSHAALRSALASSQAQQSNDGMIQFMHVPVPGPSQSLPSMAARNNFFLDARARLAAATAGSSAALGVSNEAPSSPTAFLNAMLSRNAAQGPGEHSQSTEVALMAALASAANASRTMQAPAPSSSYAAPAPTPASLMQMLERRKFQLQQQQALRNQFKAEKREALLQQFLASTSQEQHSALMKIAAEREEQKERAAALLSLRVPASTTPRRFS